MVVRAVHLQHRQVALESWKGKSKRSGKLNSRIRWSRRTRVKLLNSAHEQAAIESWNEKNSKNRSEQNSSERREQTHDNVEEEHEEADDVEESSAQWEENRTQLSQALHLHCHNNNGWLSYYLFSSAKYFPYSCKNMNFAVKIWTNCTAIAITIAGLKL